MNRLQDLHTNVSSDDFELNTSLHPFIVMLDSVSPFLSIGLKYSSKQSTHPMKNDQL